MLYRMPYTPRFTSYLCKSASSTTTSWLVIALFLLPVTQSWVAGVGSALPGDAVELTEATSLTAAVDQAMISEPQEQGLAGSPRDMEYDANLPDPDGTSPVSDENTTDFVAVRSVLGAIDAREPTSD